MKRYSLPPKGRATRIKERGKTLHGKVAKSPRTHQDRGGLMTFVRTVVQDALAAKRAIQKQKDKDAY